MDSRLVTSAAFLVAVLFIGTIQGQGPATPAQPPTPCMDQFNNVLAQRCFDSRGVSYQGVLNMLSQGQQGTFPTNTTREALQGLLCREDTKDYIVPCTLQLGAYYLNQTSCAEREREVIGTIAAQFAGALTPFCLDPCEMPTNQRIMQCFASAQIDPNRVMNTSMLADKFNILGNNSADVQQFCNNHGVLFTCLDAERARCAAFEKRMFEEGVDFVAMRQASAVLCQRQQDYLPALQCFTQNQQATQSCMATTAPSVQAVLLGRLRFGTIAPSQMVQQLCTLRMQLIPCQLQVFQQTSCNRYTNILTEFECNILASPCKEITALQPDIVTMCQSSLPPQQTITARPAVTSNPINNNINNFVPNGNNLNNVPNVPTNVHNNVPTNVHNNVPMQNNNNVHNNVPHNNNNNVPNNNNNVNTGASNQSGNGPNGSTTVSGSGSVLTSLLILVCAVFLH